MRVFVFPHEPHQKFQPRHKLAVYERNLDWFRFWLQDFEDADLRKADQYAHWRSMKKDAPDGSAPQGLDTTSRPAASAAARTSP